MDVRKVALKENCDIIYGTIRLIKEDDESFLSWAKEDYACTIFNLRVFHTPNGIEKAKRLPRPDREECSATFRGFTYFRTDRLSSKGSGVSELGRTFAPPA